MTTLITAAKETRYTRTGHGKCECEGWQLRISVISHEE